MIVLDASVMIALLDGADVHASAGRAVLLDSGRERVVAHRLTIAEALTHPAMAGRARKAASVLDAVGVGRIDELDDPVALAELRATTGLRMPDCCVLLAARRDHAHLATFDQRLAAVARDQGLVVVGGA